MNRALWSLVNRVANIGRRESYTFRMRSGEMKYVPVSDCLKAFGDLCHGDNSSPAAQIIESAVWMNCSGLKSLMLAVKNPIDTGVKNYERHV